jgi:hypothetical protein
MSRFSSVPLAVAACLASGVALAQAPGNGPPGGIPNGIGANGSETFSPAPEAPSTLGSPGSVLPASGGRAATRVHVRRSHRAR